MVVVPVVCMTGAAQCRGGPEVRCGSDQRDDEYEAALDRLRVSETPNRFEPNEHTHDQDARRVGLRREDRPAVIAV